VTIGAFVVAIIGSLAAAWSAAGADLQVEVDSSGVSASGTIHFYSVRLQAVDAQTASNVTLTIPVPLGTSFHSINQAIHSPAPECAGPAIGAQGNIVCTFTSFTGTVLYFVRVRVDPLFPEGATFTISASATQSTSDPVSSNNSDSALVTNTGGPADVQVTKRLVSVTDHLDSSLVRARYIVIATNLGPNAARHVRLDDPGPTGFGNLSHHCSSGFSSCCFVQCSTPLLASQESLVLDITFIGSRLTTPVNTATVSSTSDPNASNNNASVVGLAVASLPLSRSALALFAIGIATVGWITLQRS
jgi:hypothetical protein